MRSFFLIYIVAQISIASMTGQQVYFVNQNAIGGLQNGTNWTDAFTDLQSAIVLAQYGDEIWVAYGTYLPSSTTDRSLSFEMKNGVKLLGGFNGTEIAAQQRNFEANPTRLSGNIGDTASVLDNSYHVLYGKGLDQNTSLDGFIVSDGYSLTSSPVTTTRGAGLIILGSADVNNSRPLIANCVFEKNLAGGVGGALYIGSKDPDAPLSAPNFLMNPVIRNCVFDQNQAKNFGGAIFKYGPAVGDSFILEHCNFIKNYVYSWDGGGIYFAYSLGSKIVMRDCLFEENTAWGGAGGGFYIAPYEPWYATSILLDHCVFRKNLAPEGGGFSWDGRLAPQELVTFNLTIQNCLFEENIAKNEEGGAFFVTQASNGKVNALIKNSKIIRNKVNSYFASAIYSYDEAELNVVVENCSFIGNENKSDPAAYCAGFDAGGHKVNTRINNCLFAYNGAAIFAGGNEEAQVFTQVTNCTFFRNGKQPFGKWWFPSYSQPGSPYYNKMHFYNCSIWEPGVVHDLFDNNNPDFTNALMFYLDYCSFHPLQAAGIPNFDVILGDSIFIGEYPAFTDTLNGDFSLSTCSPIRDKGDNLAAINAGLTNDLDGNPRIRYGRVDIGAYETQDSCFTISSMEPPKTSFAAVLSPNPVSSGSLLDVQAFGFENAKIEWIVRDAYGRSVSNGNALLFEKQHFSLASSEAPGIYFLELRSGKQSVWLKFIVQP